MPPLTPDTALLEGLRAGRREAFERLYGEYHGAIYNFCARIVADREEARDLTQEVFITAFDKLPAQAEPGFKLRAWLFRVATNACFNHLRSRRRLSRDAADFETTAAGVDEYERAETVGLVEQSLAQMNERYRAALVLKDLQGLPADEIAAVMQITRPTADVLVHRARASFRSAFTALSGDKVAAPASLGLVLLPLGVPAALHVLPPLPAGLAHPGLPLPDLSSAAAPTGAGLLTKIGAALTTKVGITAAAATLAVGGAAVYEVRSHETKPAAATELQHSTQAGSRQSTATSWPVGKAPRQSYARWCGHGWPAGAHHGHWDGHSESWSWHEPSHAEGTDQTTSGHPSISEQSASESHDSASGTSFPSHTSGTDTSSAGHDSGDMTDSHDAGSER
jgi:RNA polymerase sigma-70 factor (ECF subfamily)